jgi:hypothetical protein
MTGMTIQSRVLAEVPGEIGSNDEARGDHGRKAKG